MPTPSGSISGIISCATGPLEGATVVATSAVLPEGSTARSGVGGKYRIDDLPPGSYVVTVFYGETHAMRRYFSVDGATPATVDLKLEVGQDAVNERLATLAQEQSARIDDLQRRIEALESEGREGMNYAKPEPGTVCRGCGKPLTGDELLADGCPCNSPRGVNHGLVPDFVCPCTVCDPAQTGASRVRDGKP